MEKKSRVNKENYIVIQGWMLSELKLKGNELLVYAIIYGFSQAEDQRFTGSLQYLADWTNSTKQGVSKALKNLIEKGYIEKTEIFTNGVKFCEYHITKLYEVLNKVTEGMQQSLIGGIKQSLTNNIDLNNLNNNIEDNKEKEEKEKVDYQKIIDLYNSNCLSYPKLRVLSDARKKTIKARFNSGFTYEDFEQLFYKAENSSFLKGENNRKWSATFDWLIKDSNFAKVLDGNYDDKKIEKVTNDNPYAHLKGVMTL